MVSGAVDGGGMEGVSTQTVMYPPMSINLGNVNGDWSLDLTDALLALQVLVGLDAADLIRPDYTVSGADVNGNQTIGIEEVIYVLEIISETRE